MDEQKEQPTINLMENFVLNKMGTRIDWKATKNRVYQWYAMHPSNSTAADALNASANVATMKKHVRRIGAKRWVEYLKTEKLAKY